MLSVLEGCGNLLAAGTALLALLWVPMTVRAEPPASLLKHAAPVEAEFRGCEPTGSCWFRIEPLDPSSKSLHQVLPDGVSRTPGDDALSIAVRDRLNALLANMIHQNKRIVLHDLRELDDGTLAARVTINGTNLASDPILVQLREKLTGTSR
jgi:hypothetical protein